MHCTKDAPNQALEMVVSGARHIAANRRGFVSFLEVEKAAFHARLKARPAALAAVLRLLDVRPVALSNADPV